LKNKNGNNAASHYHRTRMFSDFDISVTSCEFWGKR